MARPGAKARGGAASEIGERSMRLDGKTAMITGGVSGIGKATVLEFARSGAKVICADINMEKGAELVKEAAAQKLPVEYVKIDMADRGAVRACAAQVLERHGHVDILVNAAGMNDFQLFIENKPEYIDRVLAVNLGGALHLTHALLPAMIAAGGGKIVTVARDAGRVGPAPTDTPMRQARPEKIKKASTRATAFGRRGKPQEIADAILFFASPRSD